MRELKHYLYTGLKCQVEIITPIGKSNRGSRSKHLQTLSVKLLERYLDGGSVIPVLIPMSDLTVTFFNDNLAWKLRPGFDARTLLNHLTTNHISFNDKQYLIDNHFDVFKMIEKGKALSVHDIKENPYDN
jgi:hypothetical protein